MLEHGLSAIVQQVGEVRLPTTEGKDAEVQVAFINQPEGGGGDVVVVVDVPPPPFLVSNSFQPLLPLLASLTALCRCFSRRCFSRCFFRCDSGAPSL